MAFRKKCPVRFDDVDYAQIVYFPKLFGYCHWTFEDFFAAEAGITYAQLLATERLGFPVVHTSAEFSAPLRFGDTCNVVMEVLRVGERSVENRFHLLLNDSTQVCAEIVLISTSVSLDTLKAVPVPDSISAAFRRHLVAPH